MTDMRSGTMAFPLVVPTEYNQTTGACTAYDIFPGMTLRDYFAGQGLGAAAAKAEKTTIGEVRELFGHARGGHSHAELIAKLAYAQADAMLAAREVKP